MPRKRSQRRGRGEAGDAAQVVDRGAHDLHARVGVVDPVDRHLVDPQPAALGEHEQLGVEEPAVVAHGVEQPGAERVGARGLEAALRVAEARAQHGVQDRVVGARDQLALGPAHDAGAVREPRPDREVAVARQQRGDERQQRRAGRSRGRRPCRRPHAPRDATRRRAARGRGPCAPAAGRRRRAARPPARRRSRAWRPCSRCRRSRSATRTGARRTGSGAGGARCARARPPRRTPARRSRRRVRAPGASGGERGERGHGPSLGARACGARREPGSRLRAG